MFSFEKNYIREQLDLLNSLQDELIGLKKEMVREGGSGGRDKELIIYVKKALNYFREKVFVAGTGESGEYIKVLIFLEKVLSYYGSKEVPFDEFDRDLLILCRDWGMEDGFGMKDEGEEVIKEGVESKGGEVEIVEIVGKGEEIGEEIIGNAAKAEGLEVVVVGEGGKEGKEGKEGLDKGDGGKEILGIVEGGGEGGGEGREEGRGEGREEEDIFKDKSLNEMLNEGTFGLDVGDGEVGEGAGAREEFLLSKEGGVKEGLGGVKREGLASYKDIILAEGVEELGEEEAK